MTKSIWRRAPTGRIRGGDLVNKNSSAVFSATARMAHGFFENPTAAGNYGSNTIGVTSVGAGVIVNPVVGNSPDTATDPLWGSTSLIYTFAELDVPTNRVLFAALHTGVIDRVSGTLSSLALGEGQTIIPDGPNGYPALRHIAPTSYVNGVIGAGVTGMSTSWGTDRTVEFFVRTTSTSGYIGTKVRIVGGTIEVLSSSYTAFMTGSVPTLQDGNWHHVVIESRAAGNVQRLLVDGVQLASVVNDLDDASLGTIGGNDPLGFRPSFTGDLAQLRFTSAIRYPGTTYTVPQRFLTDTAYQKPIPITSQGAGDVGPSDTYWNNVSLLVSGQDTGAINSHYDSGPKRVPIAGYADYSNIDNKFPSQSLAFTPGQYLAIPPTADFDLSSGSWTIDLWARKEATNLDQPFYFIDKDGLVGTSNSQYSIYIATNGLINATVGDGNGTSSNLTLTSTLNLYDFLWAHIALSCDGTTVRLFVNGALQASDAKPTMVEGGKYLYLGQKNGATGFSSGTTMKCQDLRVTKGTCRYTTTFSSPTAPVPQHGPIGVAAAIGNGANTIDPLVSVGAGTVVTTSGATGDSSTVTAAFTGTGAGAVRVLGASSTTASTFAGTGAGGVRVQGAGVSSTSTTSLGSGVVGSIPVTGNGAAILTGLTSSGAGLVPVAGAGPKTLDAFARGFSIYSDGHVMDMGTSTVLLVKAEQWKDESRYQHSFELSPTNISASSTQAMFGRNSIKLSAFNARARTELHPNVNVPSNVTQDQTHSLYAYVPTAGFSNGRIFGFYNLVRHSKLKPYGWGVGLSVAGQVEITYVSGELAGGNYQQSTISTGVAVPRDQWFHLAIVIDWTDNQRIITYINGVAQATSGIPWYDTVYYPAPADVFAFGCDPVETGSSSKSSAGLMYVDDYHFVTDKSFISSRAASGWPGQPFTPPGERVLAYSNTQIVGANTTSATQAAAGKAEARGTSVHTLAGTSQTATGALLPVGSTRLVGSSTVAAFTQTGVGKAAVVGATDTSTYARTGLLLRHNKGVGDIPDTGAGSSYGYGDESTPTKGVRNADVTTYLRRNTDTPSGSGWSDVATQGIDFRYYGAAAVGAYGGVWDFPAELCMREGTVETWVKLLDTVGYTQLFGWTENWASFYLRVSNVDGQMELYWGGGAAPLYISPPTGLIPTGVWSHVALTIQQLRTGFVTFTLFVDGSSVYTVDCPLGIGKTLPTGDLDYTPANYSVTDRFYPTFTRHTTVPLPPDGGAGLLPDGFVETNIRTLFDNFRWVRKSILYTGSFTPAPEIDIVGPGPTFTSASPPLATTSVISKGTGYHVAQGVGRAVVVEETTSTSAQKPNALGESSIAISPFSSVGAGTVLNPSFGDGANTVVVTSAGAGVVQAVNNIVGANTTAAFAGAGAGAVAVQGAAANTVAAATSVGAAGARATGTGANTLSALVSVGTGTGARVGAGANTVQALAGAGAGTARATGTGANTLAALASTGAGTAGAAGTAATTVVSFTQLSSGVVDVRGNSVVVTTSFVITSDGGVLVQGASVVVSEDFAGFGTAISDVASSGKPSAYSTTRSGGTTAREVRAPATALSLGANAVAHTRAASTANTTKSSPVTHTSKGQEIASHVL